ncbi:MAG: hypothetical protein AAF202_13215, partial [Pseudomonadota bacterium]
MKCHQNRVAGAKFLRESIETYLGKITSSGPVAYPFNAFIYKVLNAARQSHHGGLDLMNTDGMQMMEYFGRLVEFVEGVYPDDQEKKKQVADAMRHFDGIFKLL